MKNNAIGLLWKYIKPYKTKLILYGIFNVFKYIGLIFSPILLGLAIEHLTNKIWSSFLIALVFYFLLRVVCYLIMDFLCVRIYNYLEKQFVENVTRDMYRKINDLPAIAFEEKGTGEISNRVVSDPDKVISLFSQLIRISTRIFSFIFVFAIIIYMSWIIALEALLFIIIMSIVIYVIFPKFEKMEKTNRENSDKLNKTITETITGIREIKSLGIKNIVNKSVSNNINQLSSSVYKTNNYMNNYWNFNNLVYYIFEFIIFITAAYLVMNNQLTIALFISLQSYMWRLDEAVYSVGDFSKNYSKVKVALNRIDEIISNKLYKDELYGTKTITNPKGVIKFENVEFKYDNDKTNTLKGLSLVFEPNKKNAVIGRSGNGKSTIFNLLVRYFNTSTGQILIDDINIQDLSEQELRNNISIIRQSPHIFNLSIVDNLKLVKPNATVEEIHQVCKKAYIHDYIMSLDKQYDTMIGEGGVNLSGGQKQRLAIARTLLLNTKIILFDEATSALDNESQKYIKETIDNLVKDHTIIIVAHRLSTIEDADEIFVIDDGKLESQGSSKKLLKNSKIYKKLYKETNI